MLLTYQRHFAAAVEMTQLLLSLNRLGSIQPAGAGYWQARWLGACGDAFCLLHVRMFIGQYLGMQIVAQVGEPESCRKLVFNHSRLFRFTKSTNDTS